MRFSTCPRLKKAVDHGGDYRVDTLKIFMVGNGDRFARALKVFLPDLKLEYVSRDDANLVLSVSKVFAEAAEYCYLRIREQGMEIHAKDNEGARNAASIIAQIIRKDDKGYYLPCGTIEDWPDASYRSMMLESSGRAWLPMEDTLKYIRFMALCRMNVMQYHFMEDTGCTFPFDCLPNLKGYGDDNLKHTKQEMRDMVAYADELGIEVTPFVEVISHALELNKATGLGCPGEDPNNNMGVCVGNEATYDIIEKILTEVADVFPSDVLHIGGDEYDLSAVSPLTVFWNTCPHCKALSEKMGYTSNAELFMYSLERVNKIVNKLGKVSMVWNADLKPGRIDPELERNMVIHFYRCDNVLSKEKVYDLYPDGYIEEGFPVLNSFYPQTYIDWSSIMRVDRLVGWTHLNEPLVSRANAKKVIGGCCCAWTMSDSHPRILYIATLLYADRFWNALGDPVTYDEKYQRLLTQMMFNRELPEDVNVIAAVGAILPSLKIGADKVKFDKLTASSTELRRIKDELSKLAAKGNELAKIYEEVATLALDYMIKKENTVYEARKDRIAFEG